MNLFSKSLWPDRQKAPLGRLLLAFVLAPAILSVLLALGAFVIAGMSEPDLESVIAVTQDSAVWLTALSFLFTYTFGLLGMGVLWALGLRGILAWAGTGGGLGVLVGMIFGIAINGVSQSIAVTVFAMISLVLFVLLRWIAGVRA